MDDGGLPGIATDVSNATVEAQSAISELLRLSHVPDVLKEFQRLAQALAASAAEERKLVERNSKVKSELETAHQITRESKVTDSDLRAARDEVQLALARVNSEHVEAQSRVAKEAARREAICKSIENKSAVVEKGAGWTPNQLAQQAEMQTLRSELHIALDAKRGVLTVLRRDVDHLTQAIEKSETTKAETVEAIAVTQAEIQAAAQKTQRLSVLQKKQSSELKEVQAQVDQLQRQLASREEEIAGGAAALVRAEANLRTRKQLIDKGLQEYNALHGKTVAMTDDLDAELVSNEAIVRELRMMEERTAAFHAEESILLAEAQRAMALTALANAKLAAATQSLHEVEAEQAALATEAAAHRAASEATLMTSEALTRSLVDLKKEREILRKTLESMADKGVQIDTVISVQHSSQKMSENELIAVRKAVKESRDRMSDLHDEIAILDDTLEDARRKLASVQEQVTLQEVQERTLLKKSVLLTNKLKQQQSMYESVRDERSKYSKALTEVDAEINRISREFKSMTNMIDLHKDDILLKDQELVREHFDHHKVEKEKEGIVSETLRVTRQISSSEEILIAQAAENVKLITVVARADEERARQSKEYRAVITERDSLRAQVVQRDAELTSLYEKIKIQRSTLDKSASTFSRQKAAQHALVTTIQDLKSELQHIKLQVSSTDSLKHEIILLEKDVRAERIKSAALEQEAERPMNVHRWRQLESSNPVLYETIFRVQTLQRRLIQISEDIAQRERLTAEKEQLFKELKLVLDRQPGIEVMDQVTELHETLKQKKMQLRAMETELQTCKNYVHDIRLDLEHTKAQTERLERAYLARMSRA